MSSGVFMEVRVYMGPFSSIMYFNYYGFIYPWLGVISRFFFPWSVFPYRGETLSSYWICLPPDRSSRDASASVYFIRFITIVTKRFLWLVTFVVKITSMYFYICCCEMGRLFTSNWISRFLRPFLLAVKCAWFGLRNNNCTVIQLKCRKGIIFYCEEYKIQSYTSNSSSKPFRQRF